MRNKKQLTPYEYRMNVELNILQLLTEFIKQNCILFKLVSFESDNNISSYYFHIDMNFYNCDIHSYIQDELKKCKTYIMQIIKHKIQFKVYNKLWNTTLLD